MVFLAGRRANPPYVSNKLVFERFALQETKPPCASTRGRPILTYAPCLRMPYYSTCYCTEFPASEWKVHLSIQCARLENTTNKHTCPVYYKTVSSLEGLANERTQKLNANTSIQLNRTSFVTWTPLGGKRGTVVASTSDSSSHFVNRIWGSVHVWR